MRHVKKKQLCRINVKHLADTIFLIMGCFGLILTGLTLHWQYGWSSKYQDLELTRILKYRFVRRTITLEQYYLKRKHNTNQLVKTNTHNVIYLSDFRIAKFRSSKSLVNTIISLINSINIYGVQEGY
uniref:Uncharacterized protein n=1 Tax=Paulinella longichromatophora TaxID=1708747 RepID=A0A2H4ZQR1_9EUKA|nr:hypothetical protein PLO_878 [Paulinella longichromatophora]